MLTWRSTPDPDLIAFPPFFIRRHSGRYLLGRDLPRGAAECLGSFDTSADAKAACERIVGETNKEAA